MRTMRGITVAVALSASVGLTGRAAGQESVSAGETSLRPFDSTARVATESMRRELARVRDAQIAYYSANHRYAASAADLDLVTVDGTEIAIEGADERSYRAVATSMRVPGAELELVTLTPPPGMAPAPAASRATGDEAAAPPPASDSSSTDH